MQLPRAYDHRAVEARWQRFWLDERVYRFERADPRPAFSIDTPPPTVSGVLHVGHVFSYTHTDLIARYQRMRGKNVFYPMGWDDNGLPTERRVQQFYGVRCDPQLPYDASLHPSSSAGKLRPIGRRNFLELCARLAGEDEAAFRELWGRLGLSVDWDLTYATMDARCRLVSQLAFLDLVEKGEAYLADAPASWDVDFQTAVAQAETQERPVRGLEFNLRFGVEGGGSLTVMTTRPEMLAACVGIVVHSQDGRYGGLVGKMAITPGYRVRVPILAHHLAEPQKGTGAVMVCTFGDATDVMWWQELGLSTRMILGRDGRLLPIGWGSPGWESLDAVAAQEVHGRLAGLTTEAAKEAIVPLLAGPEAADDGTGLPPLAGPPGPVTQQVKFYEKGDRPLEILLTRQWFIRLLDKKEALLEQGRKVRWRPDFMRLRYEQWVDGLRSDWCVGRQRYLGVPIPLWYPLDGGGMRDDGHPILPPRQQLPVDPLTDVPPGYDDSQRHRPGGFTAEKDVLDTWATSSLTPRIAAGWPDKGDLFARLYPMDMRPQAHEIIRTWAFYTIARAYMLDGGIPWRNAVISGWVLDPERRKMSKSQGNVVTPAALLDAYGADAVRYWAAGARLGTDSAYDELAFKVGKRLVTKLFNAGKLVVGRLRAAGLQPGTAAPADVAAPLDRAHLSLLARLITDATAQMEEFEPAAALEAVERWFWSNLCDNYLELTKNRAYAGDRSALAAWSLSLSVGLRLLAPFLPHVTEEVWSWHHGADGRSIHLSPWPAEGELEAACGEPAVFETAVAVLARIRRHKTESGASLRAPIPAIRVTGPADKIEKLRPALDDVLGAGAVARAELRTCDAGELAVQFVLRA
jgi:valyl-tRNA synthetase